MMRAARRPVLGLAILLAMVAGTSVSGRPSPPVGGDPVGVADPGSVFGDLAALGYDLGRFRPDHAGRYPYRGAVA